MRPGLHADPREHRAELVQSPNGQTPRRQEPRPTFDFRVCPADAWRSFAARKPVHHRPVRHVPTNQADQSQIRARIGLVRATLGRITLDAPETGGARTPRTVFRDEIPTGTESKDRREGGFHRALFVG